MRVGIAGYGVVGKTRHASIQKNTSYKVVAISEANSLVQKDIPSDIDIFDDFRDLIAQTELDIIFISLPNKFASDAVLLSLENDMNVSIINIKKRNINFHARFSATQRIYKYVIFNRLSIPSIEKKRGWHIIKQLDIPLMKKGAKKLLGTKDFSTFRSSRCNAISPI